MKQVSDFYVTKMYTPMNTMLKLLLQVSATVELQKFEGGRWEVRRL